METINVVNIKCSGCKTHIKKELEKQGATNIKIDLDKQQISYKGNKQKIEQKLSKLGYPKADSKEAQSLLKKAVSFKSCAIGKFQK